MARDYEALVKRVFLLTSFLLWLFSSSRKRFSFLKIKFPKVIPDNCNFFFFICSQNAPDLTSVSSPQSLRLMNLDKVTQRCDSVVSKPALA